MIVRHRGGHTYFYNCKAFQMAGVTKDTPNPMGGTYDKDASGNLNGRVTDLASAPFNKVGTRRTYTPAEIETRARDGVAHISKQFARYGLTSVHHEGGNLPAMQDVRARGDLKHRISYEVNGRALGGDDQRRHPERLRRRLDQVRRDLGTHRGRIVLGTDDGAVDAVSERDAALQGQRHRDAGDVECVGRARASRRHPGELPRQRRCRDRHVSHGDGARAEAAAARQRAAEDHALHDAQSVARSRG